MSGISGVTIFASVDQISHGNIKAGIAARAAARRNGMACLTIFQIGFGIRSMQIRIFKRKRMRRAGSAGMTACGRPVGIREPGRETAWRCRVGWGTAFGEIVANGTCSVLLGRVAMG